MINLRKHLLSLLVPVLALSGVMAAAQMPQSTARLTLDTPTAQPGGTVKGRVAVAIPAGYHAYSNPASSPDSIPLSISAPEGAELVRVQYPRGHSKVFPDISPEATSVYEGNVQIPVELKLPADASGSHTVRLKVRVQMCDDVACYPPQDEIVTATLTVSAPPGPSPPPPGPQPQPSVQAQSQPEQGGPTPQTEEPPVSDPDEEVLQADEPEDQQPIAAAAGNYPSRATEVPLGQEAGGASAAFVVLLLGAFFAGLSLNLTPCVYPLIPITLSFFSSQAGGQSGGKLSLGVMYALGIALSFGILGAVSSLLGAGFGALAQTPTFNVLMALLLVALSLSMFGLYEISLPPFIQKQLKGRSGGAGAFTMGSLLGLAAAPCGTALIAYFITEVAKDGRLQFGIPIFVGMGLGLGLPYVFLAAAGAQLPRSADWLVSIKRILGLIVILLAFDRFLRPALAGFQVSDEVSLGITVTAFMIGAAYLVFFDRSFSSKIVAGLRTMTVLGVAAYGMMLYQDLDNMVRENRFVALERQLEQQVDRKITWLPFTIDAFEQAVGNGKPVVVDGTANWCAACQEIEHKTLSDPRVIVSMRDVVAFRMDASTGVPDEYIKATQKYFGWQSLPHIRFYNSQGDLVHTQKEFINTNDWLHILEKAGVTVIK